MTTKLAARYAKALFQSSSKTEQQDLLNNFEILLDICSRTPKLCSFLNSPEISKQQKESILKIPFNLETASRFKEKSNFLGFLSLLLQKGRFKYLTDIAKEYRNIFTNSYGIIYAHLTTAISIDGEMKEHLKEKLDQIYNKKFELTCNVDPQVIGGGVLLIANRMVDFSVKDKLERLKNELQKS